MLIYKILRMNEWEQLNASGLTNGAPIDVQDGYIHFSTAHQVRETAAKHFGDVDEFMLAAYDAADFGDLLRWEVSRGGEKFPHLYAKLPLDKIKSSSKISLVDGAHQFDQDIP